MMLSGSNSASRLVAIAKTVTQSRLLSTQTTVAIDKLRDVFEQYRLQNYQQELPTRFKKEIIYEACKTSRSQCENKDSIVQEGIQRVLANIGASERLSSIEIRSIFEELGDERGEIYSKKLLQLL